MWKIKIPLFKVSLQYVKNIVKIVTNRIPKSSHRVKSNRREKLDVDGIHLQFFCHCSRYRNHGKSSQYWRPMKLEIEL